MDKISRVASWTKNLHLTSDSEAKRVANLIKSGETNKVKMLIDRGVDVNSTDLKGFPALLHAVDVGNSEIVTLLINSGADVNIRGIYGSVLVFAIFNTLC